jgi:hypothetical protein
VLGSTAHEAAALNWQVPDQIHALVRPKTASIGHAMATEVAQWAGSAAHSIHATNHVSSHKWHFEPFDHPYVCEAMQRLLRSGVSGLTRWSESDPLQTMADPDFFEDDYNPTAFVAEPYPKDEFDFSFRGAYAGYNWELFFHVPFLIATRLTEDRRYEEARRWWHAIFDPTDGGPRESAGCFWKVKPFRECVSLIQAQEHIVGSALSTHKHAKALKYLLGAGGEQEDTVELGDQIEAWRKDPFNPHLIARMRPLAYQKATVMRYIDNIIEWADDLFRRDTMESVAEAAMLYVLADSLLGPKPVFVEPAAGVEVRTYDQIEEDLDGFSNAVVAAENLLPVAYSKESTGSTYVPPPEIQLAYFCKMPNDKLLGFWDTVADRLFKIRHCMNIEGVERQLPLYEPPIDPALLVRAAAMGLDLSSVLSDLAAPAPHYRFQVLVSKAVEFTQGVIALGGTLLAALEKRDAEALAMMRAGHETAVLELVRSTRQAQIREAQASLSALAEAKKVVEKRYEHYRDIEKVSAFESTAMDKAHEASVLEGVSQGIQAVASGLYLIPTFGLGIAGAMGSPLSSLSVGGDPLGKATEAAARIVAMLATVARDEAAKAGTLGGYERRWADWKLQERIAEQELKQLDKQILAGEIRVEVARAELTALEKQLEQSGQVEEYLREKFTNEELYDWMAGEVSTVYFQAYKLAYDLGRRAEKAYQMERAELQASFVSFGYWDGRKKGLVAGEKLLHDLRRMEAAYLEKNRREYEVTRAISLAEHFPEALVRLRATGSATISIDESLFDRDYPGHYMRRLKSVSLTIPAVVGPHTPVNCTLTLLKSEVRTSALVENGYGKATDGDEKRFWERYSGTKAVCTSTAQGDSGMFELSFRDERLLPFEGEGAVSEWRVELPLATNRFDVGALTDVVLQLSYTAREGGGVLRKAAMEAAFGNDAPMPIRLLAARQELPTEWQAFLVPTALGDHVLSFSLAGRLPFVPGSGPVRITGVRLAASWEDSEAPTIQGVTLESPSGELGPFNIPAAPAMVVASDALQEVGLDGWSLKIPQDAGVDMSKVNELYFVFTLEREPVPL